MESKAPVSTSGREVYRAVLNKKELPLAQEIPQDHSSILLEVAFSEEKSCHFLVCCLGQLLLLVFIFL